MSAAAFGASVAAVSAKPIELILLRQLASRLPIPAAIVDAEATMVYFNPPTERMLGWSFEELGEFPLSTLDELIRPRGADGRIVAAEELPLSVALHQRRPQQATMVVHGADDTPHHIVVTAVPLDGQGGAPLGAMSFFWEEEEQPQP